ncbi:hypothetical protein Q3G72_028718 [Acer saccharum]|nr:hypothetical protein Q3G72_028718 [Acer saccharum]
MAVSSKLLLQVMITLIFFPVPSTQFQNHNHSKLEVVHRDQISSSTKLLNHSRHFLARMQMDVKRVAALTQLLSHAKSYEVENLGTNSVSGHSMGFSEYLVQVGIAGVTIRMTRFSTLPHQLQLQLQLPTLLFRVGPPPMMPSSSMIVVAMQASVVTRWLRFGRGLGGAFPVGAALAPLVYNPRTQNFYYVGLSGGPIPTLASHGFLIPVDGVETVCFAFAPLASGLSIIGNVQQTGIQISIDEACGYVGFGPNVC